jgi:hypothetical protein
MCDFTGIFEHAGCCNASDRRSAIPVPGKPGEMGWLLQDVEADANGNKLQIWCLKPSDGTIAPKHGGNDFAFLYKPAPPKKDADAVWIGACVFPGVGGFPAMNSPNKDVARGATASQSWSMEYRSYSQQ